MAATSDQKATSRSLARRLAPLAVLVVILVLFFALGLQRYVSLATLRENRAAVTGFVADHPVTAPLLFIGIYVLAVAASLPGGALLSIGGGFLFGTVAGTVYIVIGATLGATILFLAARSALGDWVRRRMGQLGDRMAAELAANGFGYLLVLRLVPLFPFWLVNLVPAIVGVPLRSYVLATVLGIIPASLVFASVGAGLGAAFDANDARDLISWQQLAPLFGLAALALIPVAYKRWQARPRR